MATIDRSTVPYTILQQAVIACSIGIIGGITASLMRYGPPGMDGVAAGMAVWLTIGFLVGYSARRGVLATVGLTLGYLVAWLTAYYAAQSATLHVSLRTSTVVEGYWLTLVVPASIAIGAAASWARTEGRRGDCCLTLPLAMAILEAGSGFVPQLDFLLLSTLPTVLIGASPLLASRRRLHMGIVVASLVFGVPALWVVMELASSVPERLGFITH